MQQAVNKMHVTNPTHTYAACLEKVFATVNIATKGHSVYTAAPHCPVHSAPASAPQYLSGAPAPCMQMFTK